VRTFTIAEAAERTGLTRKALRNRVDRGQLRVVKRDGLRHIPEAELERVGLERGNPGGSSGEAKEAAERQVPASGQPHEATLTADLLERLERQAAELGELRVLTREAESLRQEREQLEGALHEARAEAKEARARFEAVVSGGWLERRRARRDALGPLQAS